MKPTKLGELTIVHDKDQRFGLDGMYYHVRVMEDHRDNIRHERTWVLTFDEAARMEARAERGLELLPETKYDWSASNWFFAGCIFGGILATILRAL